MLHRLNRLAGMGILACGVLGLAVGAVRVPVPEIGSRASMGWQIDMNAASAAEWQLLPGIGPVLARRIRDWRAGGHVVSQVEDLDTIRGIGPRTIDGLRPLVAGVAYPTPGEFTIAD